MIFVRDLPSFETQPATGVSAQGRRGSREGVTHHTTSHHITSRHKPPTHKSHPVIVAAETRRHGTWPMMHLPYPELTPNATTPRHLTLSIILLGSGKRPLSHVKYRLPSVCSMSSQITSYGKSRSSKPASTVSTSWGRGGRGSPPAIGRRAESARGEQRQEGGRGHARQRRKRGGNKEKEGKGEIGGGGGENTVPAAMCRRQRNQQQRQHQPRRAILHNAR